MTGRPYTQELDTAMDVDCERVGQLRETHRRGKVGGGEGRRMEREG